MLRPASETRVYLGNLPRNIERRDIEKFFYGYGDIAEVKLMSGFAFVEFKDPRDAKDAVQDLDGKKMLGERINIEFARGGRDRRDDFRSRDPDARSYPRPRRTGYRVIVENLSQNVSWQVSQFCLLYFCRDLKDFMRTAGEVTYADCNRDGSGKGIVEFESEDDVKSAIRKLDGVEFKGSEVMLREDLDASRLRSRSPRRNRSPPRHRAYDRGYDRGALEVEKTENEGINLMQEGVESLNKGLEKGPNKINESMVVKEACEMKSETVQTTSSIEMVGSRSKKKKKKRTKQKLVGHNGTVPVHLETCRGGGEFSFSECKQSRDDRFLDETEYDPTLPNLSFPIHRESSLNVSSTNNSLDPVEKKTSNRKKKKKAVTNDAYHLPVTSDRISQPPPPPPPPPQYRMTSRKQKDQIWNISTHDERERIKEFWLQLGEEERRGLVKIEKEAVLRKMKEQQKHSCSCSVCDRKRVAIEEELEMLYDAYYEELEQYANQQQRFSSLSLLRKNSLTGRPEDLEDSEGILDSDGDYDESILSESMDPRFDFFNFGNSLTVKGGILTVADDLLKNDGKKFIEMMEQLAERRIQREEEAVMEIETTEFDSDDEDYDEESDDDEMNTLDEEQRIEEGRRMFQIFAARMFEQRVLTAYREKVAEERQQRLLEELEEENRLKEERELKKAKEKERKKDKKKLQKQLKDQEKARKEAERLAEENALRAEEEKRLDEAKKKKEELRLKREAEKKALEEEKRRQIQDKEKELEKERKRKEAEKERQKKELTLKKDKEVKENENKVRNLKEKDEFKQSIPETISSNAIFVNRSPKVENRDSFYSITEPMKELKTPVSSSLNSSSMFSLKTEQESDNPLLASSIMFSQSSANLQNISQKSPHRSSTNLNSILQHPPGFDTTLGQNFSSTHSTYQSLASPRSIMNNTSIGVFSSSSISSNQQYDYSSLKLFKTPSNNYKGEAPSLSPKLNSYNSLPITSTTAFFRPFHYIENKDHNNITGIHESRSKVLDENVASTVSNSTAKPIKRPSPIQRPSGTAASKDDSRKSTPTVTELSEVMGSKALLDDDNNDNDSIISNHVNDASGGLSNRCNPVFKRNSPFLESINLNRHILNSQESRHRNISDQSWLSGLSDFRFSDVWPSNTNWNSQYHVTQNLLRQRCKLICLRLDEQYGSKTRLFLIDQVLNLYNDLFSDSPVQMKQILDACAISGNSQNGGGFFTCKIEGRHVMIRYDDVPDQPQCKSGFPNLSTMIFPSSNSPSIGPQSRWSMNSSVTGAF
ncbi:hypothetical protein PCK1_002738 [Pneumocystis canis]|nr:hypothetical protein PCK1_002738 [Pneumocystis canis]